MSTVQGYTTDTFASLRDVFERQLDSGEDVGASIASCCEVNSSRTFGWVHRRDEDQALGTRHDRERLVRDENHDVLVALMLSDAVNSTSTPGGQVLAGICPGG